MEAVTVALFLATGQDARFQSITQLAQGARSLLVLFGCTCSVASVGWCVLHVLRQDAIALVSELQAVRECSCIRKA